MKKMIKFPSIEQFSAIVKKVRERAKFDGLDENGKAIFNPLKIAPKLEFTGTVKLHGTNSSIAYNHLDGIWVQSRERIIDVNSDNAGFAFYVESNKDAFQEMLIGVAKDNGIDLEYDTVVIYGEWCGGSIQKGVALNQLDKMFVIFGAKVAEQTIDEDGELTGYHEGRWVSISGVKNESIKCFNIEDFPTYTLVIDFETPTLIQNELVEMTIQVEDECPVGKQFGVSGIGEGIVFSCAFDDGSVLRFKSKGEKHSKSKVKTVKAVDDVKEQAKIDLAIEITPDWRVDQAVQEVCDTLNGGVPDIKMLGSIIKWVNQDIMKEELHKFAAAGLEPKEVMSKVAPLVKQRFTVILNESLV